MVNKSVFTEKQPKADTVNKAGGKAYKLSAKHELAQLAATSMIGNTYYESAQSQLDRIVALTDQVDDEYLAKVAVYSRQKAYMKDMPAVLVAILSTRNTELTHLVFPKCIDNGRMLRTFFTIVRSGVLGRRGFGSALKVDIQQWFHNASVSKLMAASIGNDPTLRDVMRLVRPRPRNNERRALFGYLTGSDVEKWSPANEADLPQSVKNLIMFRNTDSVDVQLDLLDEIPFRWDLLADAVLGDIVWKKIAKGMGHQALRMNLNTLQRHGVFDDPEMVRYVADRLSNPEEVAQARQFPYQYFSAYKNADVTHRVKSALHDAAELSCGNVPELDKPIVIGVDTSGSMYGVFAHNNGRRSNVSAIEVASLFGAAMLRVNPDSLVVPFDTRSHDIKVDPGDTVLSITQRLSRLGGGGTDCSIPISVANKHKKCKFGGVVIISDNASWYRPGNWGATAVMNEWTEFKKKNKSGKLICVDVAPYGTAQAPESKDILNVGGFSDSVFNIVANFLSDDGRFVDEVEAITL